MALIVEDAGRLLCGTISRLLSTSSFHTIGSMEGLIIYVDWQYFLGMIGALIGIAYYVNGRFTKLETSMEWMKDALRELKQKLFKQI